MPDLSSKSEESPIEEMVTTNSIESDPISEFAETYIPPNIHQNVSAIVQLWGKVDPMAPYDFLMKLFDNRGYEASYLQAPFRKRHASAQQISDYGNDIIAAVRTSDLDALRQLHSQGKTMMACNKYQESVVHMACRISTYEVVEFMLTHGGDVSQTDDLGRNPLHDACWREEPVFDVITLLLDTSKDLIRTCDSRGATPLHYVRQVHWLQWCAYLHYMADRYWPQLTK